MCFFVPNWAIAGRNFASTRGFFEFIVPCLASAEPESVVALSVSTVALKVFGTWRRAMNDGLHQKRLNQAIRKLRNALQDPIQGRTTEVLLATLLLQFHENLSAVRGLQKAQRTHQDGALALAKHIGPNNFQTDVAKHLLLYIRHVQVTSAIWEKSHVADDLKWCSPINMPKNPSSELDHIGISVANVQYDFLQLTQSQNQATRIRVVDMQSLIEVCRQALIVEQKLEAWSENAPRHWRPFKVEVVGESRPPVMLYLESCEVYLSIQVASIWNSLRTYRLIILRVILASTEMHGNPALLRESQEAVEKEALSRKIQDIVDSVCYSVPFYLGNQMKAPTVDDLSNSSLELPGYHSLKSENMPNYAKNGVSLSRDEHTRHVVAQ